MPQSADSSKIETEFLQACYHDASLVDRAIQAGVREGHFRQPYHGAHWQLLCHLRLAGHNTDSVAAYSYAHQRGLLAALGGMDRLLALTGAPTFTVAAVGPSLLAALLDVHAKREAWRCLQRGVEALESGNCALDDVGRLASEAAAYCAGARPAGRTTADIADEAIRKVEEDIGGHAASRVILTTGLPMLDRSATPMEAHEIVVVGARTSHGKSSFLLQVAGHCLSNDLKVAIFSLETSDRAVLEQIVAQRARVNRRRLGDEPPERQQAYLARLRLARNAPNLVIFDKDLTVDAIAARCRILAQSFRPNLVIIDYLQLMQAPGSSGYERVSAASKALIPIAKSLGCTVMVGAQLNQESEKENREPKRTDFRDSGQIAEDASRVIALWRHSGQPLDLDHYDYSILQLKHREGPLCKVEARYHAPHTLFYEPSSTVTTNPR